MLTKNDSQPVMKREISNNRLKKGLASSMTNLNLNLNDTKDLKQPKSIKRNISHLRCSSLGPLTPSNINTKSSKILPSTPISRNLNHSVIIPNTKEEKSPSKSLLETSTILNKSTNNLKQNISVASMLTRFKEKDELILRKKEELKRRIEEQQLSILKFTPDITRTSFKLENEDFFKRMEIKSKESENKKRILLEREMQKKIEEAKLNPKLNKKINEKVIQGKINSMIKWDLERKEKIKLKQEEEEKNKTRGCTFKPVINKNSKKLLKNRVGVDNSLLEKSNNKTFIVEKKNLIKDFSAFTSTDTTVKEISVQCHGNDMKRNLSNFTQINAAGINLSLDPKILEKVSEKESKIMEELLKKRVSSGK
jgi:hypothetical protein